MKNLSQVCIERPIGVSLLALALLILGVFAYVNLPVAPLPRIDLPTIAVSASLPGGSPETMAQAIATPLERHLGQISGLTEMTSSNSLGSSSIVLQFDMSQSIDVLAKQVQAAILAATADLPSYLPQKPSYRKVNTADFPIMVLSLTSEHLSLPTLYDLADTILAQKISQLQGVAQVFVGGGQQPAVRIQADPLKLTSSSLSLEDIRQAVHRQSQYQAQGALMTPSQMVLLDPLQPFQKASDVQQMVVSIQPQQTIFLGDIAKVFDDVVNPFQAAWIDSAPGILLIIRRQPAANMLQTIERIKNVLPTLRSLLPLDSQLAIAIDRSRSVRSSLREMKITMALTLFLVVAVVYMFLKQLRIAMIPIIAIPLTLLGTLTIMSLFDVSINNLTLMALIIATGFVVDDAIVVTEHIISLLEKGENVLQAALKGSQQIFFTVLSMTLSLVCVFIPLFFMTGIVGKLFYEFALTLTAAMLVSLLISLTVTPCMCASLLKDLKMSASTANQPTFFARWWLWRLTKTIQDFWDNMQQRYNRRLTKVLHDRRYWLVMLLLVMVANVYLLIKVSKGLFPQQDVGMLSGSTEASQNISFQSMKKAQGNLDALLRDDKAIEHVLSFLGSGPSSGAVNTGSMFIALKPLEQRHAHASEIISRLSKQSQKEPQLLLYLQAVQDLRVGGRSTKTQYLFSLQDADLKNLRRMEPFVLKRLQSLKTLQAVTSDMQNSGLQWTLNIDRQRTSFLGFTINDIDQMLYSAFGQRQIATMYHPMNTYRMVLEAMPPYNQSPEAVGQLYFKKNQKDFFPLQAISHPTLSFAPLSVQHQGQLAAVTFSFNVAEGYSLSDATKEITEAMKSLTLPSSMNGAFQGTAKMYQKSSTGFVWLLLSAIAAVYIILGMLYESYIHPLTILSTLPTAGLGAVGALMLTGQDLGVIALIGMLLLIGIVKKNAIMMIDVALELRRDNTLEHTASSAILKAASMRFRPIMMTTLAALLGAIPLALGLGEGSELRQPLGITIVGGLLISQWLTLFTTPVVYYYMDKWESYRFQKRSLKGVA